MNHLESKRGTVHPLEVEEDEKNVKIDVHHTPQ